MSYLPCENPSCHSYGTPHPNCRCHNGYAEGGSVHFCSSDRPHMPGCEYFAEGGAPEIPQETYDHVAAHKGLLGVLTDVGHSKLSNENHHEKLSEAKGHAIRNDREALTDSISNHPLVGGIGKTRLKPITDRLVGPLASNDVHPQSFRSAVDFHDSAQSGADKIHSKISGVFEKSEKHKPDESQRESLKNKLTEYAEDPKKLLDIGGSLGHYLPAHAAQTAESAMTAIGYLNSIKPRPQQPGVLDPVMPPTKVDEEKFNRALDIAIDPTLVVQHAKDGTINESDMMALTAMYPNLSKSIMNKATEQMINNSTKHDTLSYAQKRSLSVLLNQPVMFSQTPQAMQAIMQANAGAQDQPQPQQKTKKASGVELKQINMVNKTGATPLQEQQLDRKA